MSLVEASAALDQVWAEYGIVSTTAGVLADVSACIDHVGANLKRGALSATSTPTSTEVGAWLARAKQEIAEVKNFTWRRRHVTGSLTSGSFRVALPPDYGGGHISIRDMTNDRSINIVNNHIFNTYWPDINDDSTNDPRVATIKNNEVWFAPPPAVSVVVELEYDRTGDDLGPTDFVWLPEIERFRCCDFATSEAFGSLHLWQPMQIFRGKWKEGVQKAVRGDGKKKWAATGYRALDIFHG